jgi:Asp-tRNA(Asn)/Glu-tRNA(Gln) amidotransferase B subunit
VRVDFNNFIYRLTLSNPIFSLRYRSVEEADAYLRKLAALLRHLGICNARSDEGSLRCDVNVSVRR